MSDLSQLLGDLYADDTPHAPAPAPPVTEAVAPTPAAPLWSVDDEHDAQAPSWSSESALDEAFATWVPGPTDDAPSAERSIVAGVMDARPAPGAVATAPAPVQTFATVQHLEPAPMPAPASLAAMPASVVAWSPSDDDILPVRRGRRRR